MPDVKLHSETGIVLEDISDTDTIDYTSDTEFNEKVPQHPRDTLKSKIKRKITKKQKNNKKSKQKTNIRYTIKKVFDEFEDEKNIFKN